MTKRAFIDAVRQFTTLSKTRGVSYAEQVAALLAIYEQSVIDTGAEIAEQEKLSRWATDFVLREYGAHDGSISAVLDG